jgi:CHAT domain-containing protein
LAVHYDEEGRLKTAEPLYERSLSIRAKALGLDHPDYTSSLSNLAFNLFGQREYSKCLLALKRSLQNESTWLIREVPFLTEKSRPELLNKFWGAWQLPLTLSDRFPYAAQLAEETRLNRQGLLLEIEQRQSLLLLAGSADRSKVEQLQALTQQLASISLQTNRRAAIHEKRDRLQTELYRQLPELQIQLVSPSDIARILPTESVLVEFQRYRPYQGSKPKDQRWGEPHYLALILKPDNSIQAVQLGPASPIDAAVQKGLAATAQNQLDAKTIWRQVSDRVLRPLLPHLTGSHQWFLSLDGELNRVPFAALPSPQNPDVSLAEAVQLRQLTTGRDLLRLQKPVTKGEKPVVIANPSFDRSEAVKLGVPQTGTTAVDGAVTKQQRSSVLGNKAWIPLPASVQEGNNIAQLLSGRLFTGPTASVSQLERLQSPRILHIATHGFFVADPESQPQDPLRLLQDQAPQLRGLQQDDPQLRSGLVLAGANQPDADPNDDGYLTAAEAVSLNLKGTELVVLSACNTAQGDIRTGEGVYGLQRSLEVAGARSTLLSLWKVDDAATLEFMTRFYKRLIAGEGRAEALAATQKEFRDGIPGKPDWKEPYYWAAWQLVGDWRPIPGL